MPGLGGRLYGTGEKKSRGFEPFTGARRSIKKARN
jgi:hypothetical protein